MEIELRVRGLGVSTPDMEPLVVLQPKEGGEDIIIVSDPYILMAIQREMRKEAEVRPLTHGLLKSVIEGLGATLTKVVITEYRDNMFYALLHLEIDGRAVTVDSSPTDAVAIALKTNSPIYIESSVIETLKMLGESAVPEGSDQTRTDIDSIDFNDPRFNNIPKQ